MKIIVTKHFHYVLPTEKQPPHVLEYHGKITSFNTEGFIHITKGDGGLVLIDKDDVAAIETIGDNDD